MAVFITLCKCTVKIIYNHFKTWPVPVNISSLNTGLRFPPCTFTHLGSRSLPPPSAHPSKAEAEESVFKGT